jgi:hypothetical protein
VKFRRLLGFVAALARPILGILGVKRKTVASKAAEVIEVVDRVIPPSK